MARARHFLIWVARLDHLPDGENLRFNDPEVLLAHLQALLPATGPPGSWAAAAAMPDEEVIDDEKEESRNHERRDEDLR
jgi:hypothetical protein